MTALLTVAILLNPPLSEKTTRGISGTVTDVYDRYSNHGGKTVYIVLDDGSLYKTTYSAIKDNGTDYNEWKTTLKGKSVEIRFTPQ